MKRIIKGALCALITFLLLFMSACSDSAPETLSFEAMDTVITLTVYGGGDIAEKLKSETLELDRLFDATDENSEIYRLNEEKTADVGDETARLLRESLSLCKSLDGYFDITVYPAMLEWGFTTGEYKVPDDDTLADIAERIDHKKVELSGNKAALADDAMLDLGAVAKGYAAQRCKEILAESGAQAAVLNFGGTICLYGQKPDGSPFKVGIADPENSADYFGYLSCGEGIISTSGGYERYFELDGKRYIHILDPTTAKPVDNGILSVTVISDNGANADALSTAIFVMGLDKAIEFYGGGFEADGGRDFIILTESGELYITRGVIDDFTLADGYDYRIVPVK